MDKDVKIVNNITIKYDGTNNFIGLNKNIYRPMEVEYATFDKNFPELNSIMDKINKD